MTSSFEKSVKGATKIKAAPPKSKYIEHILIATHSGESGVAEIFRALQNRLRDSTWTVVFKSLITVHLMIREGSPDVTLAYLAKHKSMLAISSFSDVQTQGRNIRHYANYLTERARAYRETRCDFVRGAERRLEKMTVEKGLLRETEIVQQQISSLLKCDVLDNEPENEITITVFRMLILDLLALFHVMNQAMINLLGHFFEMSRSDAERALSIYKAFTSQTDYVVGYLATARQVEHQTRVEVPSIKHAPVHLVKRLEEYLNEPDFEIQRRQYLAEQQSSTGGAAGVSKVFGSSSKTEPESKAATTAKSFPDPTPKQVAQPQPPPVKGPDPDLIDFFESIEQNQQPMSNQPQLQQGAPQPGNPLQFNNGGSFQPQQTQYSQNGFPQQQTGFPQQQPDFQNQGQFQQQFNTGLGGPQMQQPQQVQPNFTGAGFGGYTQQPAFQPGNLSSIPQDSALSFQQQQQSQGQQMQGQQLQGQQMQGQQMQGQQMLGQQQIPTGNQQVTNPFRLSTMASPTGNNAGNNFSPPPVTTQLTRQSTNPFAKSVSPPSTQPFSPPPELQQQQFQQYQQQQQPAPLKSMATGTNPFAKNLAMNANTNTNAAAQRPQTSGGLLPQPTGSTNPFRQSQFGNTATGAGWQNNQQPMGGGLDNLETIPVFPRPAQHQAWQQ